MKRHRPWPALKHAPPFVASWFERFGPNRAMFSAQEDTMFVRILLASVHLLALGIGMGSVWARGRALLTAAAGKPASADPDAALRNALTADNFWGVAAALWIVTGLARAFAGFEKGSAYYLHNTLFWVKMTLFIAIFALELRP